MKRFLLFGGDHFYARGGWVDFLDSYDTLEDAKDAGEATIDQWWNQWFHIVDASSFTIVAWDAKSAKFR